MSIRLLLIAVAWFGCNKGEEQVTRPDLQIVSAGNEPDCIVWDIDSGKKLERAVAVGKAIAARAKEKGFARVVFDSAGYRYHGRVKAVADGAREGGLEF